jgi:hypothetical protein
VTSRRELSEADRQGSLQSLAQRARQAFLDGAEEESRRAMGRPLTPDEQQRVLDRYPGDWFCPPGCNASPPMLSAAE